MAELETLKGLISQVRGAAEPSVELDEAIHAALLPDDPWWQAIVEGRRLVVEGREDAVIDRCNCRLRADTWAKGSKVSPYTESADAALRLVGRALPDAYLEIGVGAHKEGRRISTAFIRLGDHDIGECWEAATAPLAVCAALLTALLAQAEAPSTSAARQEGDQS